MALVVSPQPITPTTDPTAPLVAAIAHFESILTDQQRWDYRDGSVRPVASDVIAFVTKIDSDNQAQTRRCVASRLCTFLDAARQFTGVVDTFVSANPGIAALIWGSIKFTIVTASNVASYFDKVTNMIMNIGKFCPIYKKFEQLFANSVDLQCALCEYYAAVIRLCVNVVEVSQRPALKQLLASIWNPFESEFKMCRDELDQAIKLVDLHIRLAAQQAANETAKMSALERQETRRYRAFGSTFRADVQKGLEDVRQWHLRQLTQRFSELRSRIRDNLSTTDYLNGWKRIYQQRAPSTAEWLQKDTSFLSWRRDEKTAIMWCPGTLGIGKTVLASNIVAHLQQTQTSRDVVCYCFCEAENRASLSARVILGTLARQMISTQIERAMDDELDRLSQLTKDLEAKDVFVFMLPYLSRDQDYYLVLDGLDETERGDIEILARSIAMLCEKRIKGLKIICTGRPELGQYLFRLKNFDYQIAVAKPRLMDDIDRYTEVTLSDLLEKEILKLGDPTLILEIQDTLRIVSEGIFLWTRLFIEEICAQTSDNEIRKALQNPPRKISQLIDMKMARLREHSCADQALKLLRYGGVLKRPLNTDEYQELLSISIGQQSFDRGNLPNDMVGIIAACYGLVSVDPEESTIHYIHYSIRQYLFSSNGLHGVEFNECDSDTYLGELCLTYLDFNDFKRQLTKQNVSTKISIQPVQIGLLSTARPGSIVSRVAQKLLQRHGELRSLSSQKMEQTIHELTRDVESSRLSRELSQREFCFLNYARQYWIDHLKQLDKDRSTRSWGLFCKMVSNENLLADKPWCAESTSTVTDPIHNIVNWSTRNEHHALLVHVLWTNAKALTETHKEEILCCTTTSSSLSPRLVSIMIQHVNCQMDTLIKGLIHAAKTGQKDCVETYLTAHIPLDYQGSRQYEMTALQAAASGGHLDVIDRLLTAGAEVNAAAARDNGRTALQAATGGGHLDVMDRLLTAGAEINATAAKYYGRTALQAAAGGGYLDIVDRLLTAGAEVNAAPAEYYGMTALQAAADGGHLDVVDRLLTAGAEVNAAAAAYDGGRTALQAAASGGHLDVVDRLLTAGAEVNAPAGSYGMTALQAAADGGYLDVVDRLLIAGAEIDAAPAEYGMTALQAAAGGGYLDVVDRLLTAGAEVNAAPAERCGRTALQAAAGEGHLDVVDRLLTAGAEVNAPAGSYGITALQAAAGGGHLDVMDRLLTAGAEVNAAPAKRYGITALQAAADGGYLDVMDKLLTAGAEVNAAPAEYGRTALQAAARGGYLGVVDRLLTAGAEVNAAAAAYDGGRTALQAAASGGHLDVVDRLLTAGAKVNATNKSSRTALYMADKGGHLNVARRLRTAGAY